MILLLLLFLSLLLLAFVTYRTASIWRLAHREKSIAPQFNSFVGDVTWASAASAASGTERQLAVPSESEPELVPHLSNPIVIRFETECLSPILMRHRRVDASPFVEYFEFRLISSGSIFHRSIANFRSWPSLFVFFFSCCCFYSIPSPPPRWILKEAASDLSRRLELEMEMKMKQQQKTEMGMRVQVGRPLASNSWAIIWRSAHQNE